MRFTFLQILLLFTLFFNFNNGYGQELIRVTDKDINSAVSCDTPLNTFFLYIKSTKEFELNQMKSCFTKQKQKEMMTFTVEELKKLKKERPRNYNKVDGYRIEQKSESATVVYHTTTKTTQQGNVIIRKYVGELSMIQEGGLWKIQNYNEVKVKQYLANDEKP